MAPKLRRVSATAPLSREEPVVAGTLTVRGVEYVVIPKADYLRIRSAHLPEGVVDVAESGTARVSERYVAAALDACGVQAQRGLERSSPLARSLL